MRTKASASLAARMFVVPDNDPFRGTRPGPILVEVRSVGHAKSGRQPMDGLVREVSV